MPIEYQNRFFPNGQHQETQILENLKLAKHFYQAETFMKMKGARFDQMIFLSKKKSVRCQKTL